MSDALRLAIGTLTRLPVPAPRNVNQRTACSAMLVAPVVGALLGLIIGAAADVVSKYLGAPTLVVAVLTVAAVAWSTRALHLDGLADTADALGSGAPAERALAIARRSDIGPFGVVVLVLTLLLQVACLTTLIPHSWITMGIALGTSRLCITLACVRGVPAARPDGLGATVAGSVPLTAFIVAALAWIGLCLASSSILDGWWVALVAIATGLGVGAAITRVACRRLGGITGDVLGAVAELTSTAVLLALAVTTGA